MRQALSVFVLAALPLAAQAQEKTLTLREALDATARLSPDVRQARLRVLELEAARQQAQAAYLPQAGVVVSGGYQTSNLQGIGLTFPGVPSRTGPYRTFTARPVVTQTVLDLSLLSQIRAARERTAQSRFDEETVRESALLAVLQLYLQTFQAASRVEAAEARVKSTEATLEQARQLEAAGTASKLDVARAGQQHFAERSGLASLRKDVDVLRTLLLRAIGMDSAGRVELKAPLMLVTGDSPVLANILPPALDSRAELKSLSSRISSAKLDEKRGQRERLPKLSFSGDYGALGEGPDRAVSTYTVGATLTIPLWTGGRIAAEAKAARARLGQTEQQLRDMRLRVTQEVAQSLLERDAARRSLADAVQAAAAARESLDLSRLRFAAGLSTNLDTVSALSALAQAEDSEIRSRYDFHLATARLAWARGDVYSFFER